MSWSRIGLGILAAATLALAACSGANTAETTPPASPTTTATTTQLTVNIDNHDGRTDSWIVTCDPPGGDHPNPQQACDFLNLARSWGADPFAPVDPEQLCGQQFGGPQTATVTGTWNGKPVDSAFSLTNSCEIGRWSNAQPLLVVVGSNFG